MSEILGKNNLRILTSEKELPDSLFYSLCLHEITFLHKYKYDFKAIGSKAPRMCPIQLHACMSMHKYTCTVIHSFLLRNILHSDMKFFRCLKINYAVRGTP